jgi:hypothetical protein
LKLVCCRFLGLWCHGSDSEIPCPISNELFLALKGTMIAKHTKGFELDVIHRMTLLPTNCWTVDTSPAGKLHIFRELKNLEGVKKYQSMLIVTPR